MSTAIILSTIFALVLLSPSFADDDNDDKIPLWHGVTGAPWIRFKLDQEVSDEFNREHLNDKKWDPHGLRNENTGCPAWNGPLNKPRTDYSTYFTTYTEPGSNGTRSIPSDERQYRVTDGFLRLKISKRPLSYFESREYYCNSTTFMCNFDSNRPCYSTTFNGRPILKNDSDPTSYRYINHDKCKIEPYCIPHHRYVVGGERIYRNYIAPNIVGRKSFRYGFFEVNVKTADSSAVSAVWMYDQNVFPSYARFIRHESDDAIILESPSLIRSRRWQEIDMLEVMGTWNKNFCTSYIPNIHVFAMYKGEFTRPKNTTDGKLLGPIVMGESVFKMGRNPKFQNSHPSRANSWHMNPGSVHQMKKPWSENFHRVGLYWSEKEIRFIVDGKEVLRAKNSLVHQRMFMVLSMSFNLYWARVFPTNLDIDREFIVDYIRRWDVELDVDHVPSELKLDWRMDTTFRSFGQQFGAVDGLFPNQDDNRTVELQNVEEILANGEKRRKQVWKTKTMPVDVGRMMVSDRNERMASGSDGKLGQMHTQEGDDGEETGRKRKVMGKDVELLESRSDRNREPRNGAEYNPLNAVTVWDDGVDPLAAGAGWAELV